MAGNKIITGVVVRGNQVGRKIGYPTANLIPGKDEELLLKKGVYAVRVEVNHKVYDGMANIGIRPTLDQHELIIEAHLFDFADDIYGETITIFFHDYIREEEKFSNLDELKVQLAKDKIAVSRILSDRVQFNPDTQ